MNNKSIIKGFLFPTLLQITVVAALVGILKAKGYELGYNSFLGMVFIIFGGVSSALWGVFYQIKYNAKRPLSISLTSKCFFCFLYENNNCMDSSD